MAAFILLSQDRKYLPLEANTGVCNGSKRIPTQIRETGMQEEAARILQSEEAGKEFRSM
jgi:hypothetical protein